MSTRRELANAIRALAMDAVQKANSGHPGMPMGMADIAEVLWNDFLHHNPNNPAWINRDRFILSNGHGAMLQYALLHLTGYDLSLEDIKQFRQLHSKTPGHPEYGHTPGVETTTGPLGQGLANAVGMAIAEKILATQFNRDGYSIVDHFTYVFAGDGCLMEGISHEACSLAGTLGLGKLIAFYDDNGISIDGQVGGWFTDDTPKRFAAYDWHVIADVDGHDSDAVFAAIQQAKAVADKPTLICCKTVIAYGAPNLAGSSESHGSPLGEDEIVAARENLGWKFRAFELPNEIYTAWDAKTKGAKLESEWQEKFAAYQQAHPELAAEFLRRIQGDLPSGWGAHVAAFIQQINTKMVEMPTRKASKICLDALGPLLPELLGGSADLTGSNLTWWSGSEALRRVGAHGNYIHYGVREFAMFAIMNGVALHGGFIPYGGTFLTFVDYGRNAVRLSGLMKSHVIFVLSHDSIGLGEDGPTHQPIEHIGMLRLTPGISVWRPADAVETAFAWKYAIEHKGPTCLLLSRQNVAPQAHNADSLDCVARGGYILMDCEGEPEVIIIATGSEVQLATAAATELTNQGKRIRVVSMPCTEVFDTQGHEYQQTVLPKEVTRRVAIEAGSSDIWYKYVGWQSKIIGLDRYGESAPYKEVFKALGFTVENVINTVNSLFA
jgi:transketolase